MSYSTSTYLSTARPSVRLYSSFFLGPLITELAQATVAYLFGIFYFACSKEYESLLGIGIICWRGGQVVAHIGS